MSYKAVAFDMDGTLLASNRLILAESIDTIAAIRKRGINVILVSGRHHTVMYPYYHQLNLNTAAICCNGTYLYDFNNQTYFDAKPIGKTQAKTLLNLVNKYGVHTLIYTDKSMVYEVMDDHLEGLFKWIDSLPEGLKPDIAKVASFESLIDSDCHVFKFATSSHDLTALQAFSKAVEEEQQYTCEWSWVNRADISSQGNTKGNGLAHWAKHEGIDLKDIVAFGDSYNDISMLKAAGLGIAMGNADDEVKKHANYVIGDNNQPSIADELEKLFL